ncbi:MAG: DUF72 domain-containing protein [Bryobacteraceae bacterium]|jgi:uncharacterized protein YecE (DUF72 family)
MATLYAGTSGFAYTTWKPALYPAKLPAKGFLKHYAERLNSVEINYTFRRLPAPATLASWVEATPPGFVFAVKANQRITHILRLRNAEQATEVFFRAIDPLRSARRLGPVLFQLPPNLKCDVPLLSDYLALLPKDIRHAFEFRNTSWLADPVYDLLRQHGIALCVAESEKLEIPEVITSDFVYYRLRKPEYSPEDLASIAARARELLATGRDLYLMFKHEDTPEGALNAERLLKA